MIELNHMIEVFSETHVTNMWGVDMVEVMHYISCVVFCSVVVTQVLHWSK